MNALALRHDLKARGVLLASDGERLLIDAPSGMITEEIRASLRLAKPVLLKIIAMRGEPEDSEGFLRRRFEARLSKRPGYTSLYDPVEDEWHDFPTKDCFPSIVALASSAGKRKKGGVA